MSIQFAHPLPSLNDLQSRLFLLHVLPPVTQEGFTIDLEDYLTGSCRGTTINQLNACMLGASSSNKLDRLCIAGICNLVNELVRPPVAKSFFVGLRCRLYIYALFIFIVRRCIPVCISSGIFFLLCIVESVRLDFCLTLHCMPCLSSLVQPRFVINRVTAGDFECPKKVAAFLNDLFAAFKKLNLRNDMLRKRFDSK